LTTASGITSNAAEYSTLTGYARRRPVVARPRGGGLDLITASCGGAGHFRRGDSSTAVDLHAECPRPVQHKLYGRPADPAVFYELMEVPGRRAVVTAASKNCCPRAITTFRRLNGQFLALARGTCPVAGLTAAWWPGARRGCWASR